MLDWRRCPQCEVTWRVHTDGEDCWMCGCCGSSDLSWHASVSPSSHHRNPPRLSTPGDSTEPVRSAAWPPVSPARSPSWRAAGRPRRPSVTSTASWCWH